MANRDKFITIKIKDPNNQLDLASYDCYKAHSKDSIQKIVQQISEKTCSLLEHLRVQYKDAPVLFKKPDGSLTSLSDLEMQNGDTIEVFHRHGNLCRFCRKTIYIKLRAENGYACSYHVDKNNPLKNIIAGFAKYSLTSIENLKLSYLGQHFELVKPDGNLLTAQDLKMGDSDQIDIRHQR